MKKTTDRLARVLATWFGCGLSPFAPGTVGSAAAIGIALALEKYASFEPWQFPVLAAVMFAPAVWAAGTAAAAAKIKDPGFVVIDEVIGQWIALAGARTLNWKSWLLAFAAVSPVRYLEARRRCASWKRLPGGLGINADDAMAGVYAALVLLAGRMVQSLLNMPLRKSSDSKPQIAASHAARGHCRRRVADSG